MAHRLRGCPQGPLRGASSPSPLPVGLAFGKAVLLGRVLSRGLCSYDCHRVHLVSGKFSIFTPQTLELGPVPTSARSPHFASFSPLDFPTSVPPMPGVQATVSKEFSHVHCHRAQDVLQFNGHSAGGWGRVTVIRQSLLANSSNLGFPHQEVYALSPGSQVSSKRCSLTLVTLMLVTQACRPSWHLPQGSVQRPAWAHLVSAAA